MKSNVRPFRPFDRPRKWLVTLLSVLVAFSLLQPAKAESPLVTPALIELEATLQTTFGSDISLETPLPAGKRAPTYTELASALALTIGVPGGEKSTELTKHAVRYAPDAAPILIAAAVNEILDGGADNPLTNDNKFDKAKDRAALALQLALQESQWETKTDSASAIAAIVASAVAGVDAASQTTPELTDARVVQVIKAFVGKAAKAASTTFSASVQVNVPDADNPADIALYPKLLKLDNRDEPGNIDNDGLAPSYAVAGVVTGAVTLAQNVGNLDSNELIFAIVEKAVQKVPKRYREIAIAATQAAATVFGNVDLFDSQNGDNNIVKAVKSALKKLDLWTQGKKIATKQAVAWGLAQAEAGELGAGAAGVANYTWNQNAPGNAVTDISGF